MAALVGVVIALEMAAVLLPGFRLTDAPVADAAALKLGNTKLLGIEVYTRYLYPLQIAAVLLLVAIIAAIALTLRRAQGLEARRPVGAGPGEEGRPHAHRPDEARSSCRATPPAPPPAGRRTGMSWTITLGHYLSLGAILFALSVIGIFLNRKNLIVLLMAIELMLLAVNLNFVAFSYYLGDMAGQVFVFFILTVAAAESAIGLAILVVLFRNRATINVDELDALKG